MILYPTIEIQGGRCVSLECGRLEQALVWHVDPVEMARSFAAAGAQWMMVTDFDAIEGNQDNDELIEDIIRAAGIPVQLGGGFRTRERVEHWIEKGAGRIVIGTAAVRDPAFVHELAKFYPDQIVLAVDVWQGQVMTDGWRAPSAFVPEDFVAAFENAPLAGVMVSDIDGDVDAVDAKLSMISGVAAKTRHQVIARGTVRHCDDIASLKYIPNIAGAVVGRALFSRDIDLGEALGVAQPVPEMTAEFQ
ncbi:MAG: 1-(5-phosphoribosyl)-5-[(5-phosphoribosylamino)methylideneamino] imidazole-4-carboxamide isomerase [Rhodobacterales bacterium]|nr:1-(5-phosphoribosyl)-5-[(5-phosphoribosylamino)methylideneamino] imidazole-4-carboxamide isomerase [Rhodobacterales bacterium]